MKTKLSCLWKIASWLAELQVNATALACFVLLLWLIFALWFWFWLRDIFQGKSSSGTILLMCLMSYALIFTCGLIIGEGLKKCAAFDKQGNVNKRTQNLDVWTDLGTYRRPVQETTGEDQKLGLPDRHFSTTVRPFNPDLDRDVKQRTTIRSKQKTWTSNGTTPVPLTCDLPDHQRTLEVDLKVNKCTEKPVKGIIDSILSLMTGTETMYTVAPAGRTGEFDQDSSDEEQSDDSNRTRPESCVSSTRNESEEEQSTAESGVCEHNQPMAEQPTGPIQQESGPEQTLAEAAPNTVTSGEGTRSPQGIYNPPNPALDLDRIRPFRCQRGLHRYQNTFKTDTPTQSSKPDRDEKCLNPRRTDGTTTVTVPEKKERKEPEGAVGGAEARLTPPIVTTYKHPAFQQEDHHKEKKSKEDSDTTLVPPPISTYQPREQEALDDAGEDTKEDSEEEEFPHEEEDIT